MSLKLIGVISYLKKWNNFPNFTLYKIQISWLYIYIYIYKLFIFKKIKNFKYKIIFKSASVFLKAKNYF